MNIEQHNKDIKKIEEKAPLLPWYVIEFLDHAQAEYGITPKTTINYIHDYLLFFNWLTANNYFDGIAKDVPLSVLESLRVKDITSFRLYCMNHRGNQADAVARKVSALKSLFDYLTNQAEHEKTYEPYLIRNVMAKVKRGKNEKKKETLNNRSERIKGSILYTEDEFMDFRAFIAEEYKESIKEDKRKLLPYLQNRERDIAIVSLILGSGIRLSEVAGLDIDEIDQKERSLSVLRKGKKADNVIFSKIALDDLQDYLAVRTKKYNVSKDFKPVFISAARGDKGLQRMAPRSIQAMMERYAKAYGKPGMTVHKLRHSFATRNYDEHGDLLWLQEQLGHSDPKTTGLYAHVLKERKQENVENM